MSSETVFAESCKHHEQEKNRHQRRSDVISNVRFIVFIAGIAITAAFFKWSEPWSGWISGGVFLALFLAVLKRHDLIERQVDYCRGMIQVNARYLDRLNGSWTEFPDCGQEFASIEHQYTGDLDIFGPRSLYQWLSVAHTHTGKQRLRELLEQPDMHPETIQKRQHAVRELAAIPDFALDLECCSLINPAVAGNPQHLLTMAEKEEPLFRKPALRFLAALLPLITLLCITAYFAGPWDFSGYIPVGLLAVQAVIVWLGTRYTEPVLGYAYLIKANAGVYIELFLLIENSSFNTALLKQLRLRLFNRGRSASEIMKRLDQISDAINLRYQPIVYFVVNVLLLWDYHCAFRLESWKERYGQDIRGWMESIALFEALSSVAVTARLHPEVNRKPDAIIPSDYANPIRELESEWCWPEVIPEYGLLTAEALGHPLIAPSKCVRNDLALDHEARIVTGSNMSGKSTLLRAAGINLVLAYAGGAVCARQFRCSIMDVMTSMVIRDDLSSGISTFYAELLRISRITEQVRTNHRLFYLIDELFRGTNSLDRIAGARAVLNNLQAHDAIGMISTHDFELCGLADQFPGKFVNCHFEEQYLEGQLSFDYKLREGRCTTSNAHHLMRLVGIEIDP